MYIGVAPSAYIPHQQLPFVYLSSLEVHTPLMQSAIGRTDSGIQVSSGPGRPQEADQLLIRNFQFSGMCNVF